MTPEELFCTMLLAMTGDDEPRVNEQDEAQEAQEAQEAEERENNGRGNHE